MVENRVTTQLTPELACRNLKESVAFYTEVLGFHIQYERPEDGFAMLEREGSRIMLDEIGDASKSETGRTWFAGVLEAPFGRGINLQMHTQDVSELYAKVRKSGAKIFLPLEEKWYRANDLFLGNLQFIVQDPDGYLLRFAEDLGEREVPKS